MRQMTERPQRTVEPVDEHVMLPPRPLAARKGRGAVSKLQGRFEVDVREPAARMLRSGDHLAAHMAEAPIVNDPPPAATEKSGPP